MTKNNKSPKRLVIDYYIFIDYSGNLVGYIVIDKKNLSLLLPKIIKFRHYKEERHKQIYVWKIKKEIKNTDLKSLLLKQRILQLKDNLILFTEIIQFLQGHDNFLSFISVDNNQFNAFVRLLEKIPHRCNITVRKESELRKNSLEYKLSLIIDTLLNIERMSK